MVAYFRISYLESHILRIQIHSDLEFVAYRELYAVLNVLCSVHPQVMHFVHSPPCDAFQKRMGAAVAAVAVKF